MGKQISKTPTGPERYPGLEGLGKYYSLSIVIWRKEETLSKAYAVIYSRFPSKMGSCIVSEKWLGRCVDVRFALGSEAKPSQWLDFVCVCVDKSGRKQIKFPAGIRCHVVSSAHLDWRTLWFHQIHLNVKQEHPTNVVRSTESRPEWCLRLNNNSSWH